MSRPQQRLTATSTAKAAAPSPARSPIKVRPAQGNSSPLRPGGNASPLRKAMERKAAAASAATVVPVTQFDMGTPHQLLGGSPSQTALLQVANGEANDFLAARLGRATACRPRSRIAGLTSTLTAALPPPLRPHQTK